MPEIDGAGGGTLYTYRRDEIEEGLKRHGQLFKELPDGAILELRYHNEFHEGPPSFSGSVLVAGRETWHVNTATVTELMEQLQPVFDQLVAEANSPSGAP